MDTNKFTIEVDAAELAALIKEGLSKRPILKVNGKPVNVDHAPVHQRGQNVETRADHGIKQW